MVQVNLNSLMVIVAMSIFSATTPTPSPSPSLPEMPPIGALPAEYNFADYITSKPVPYNPEYVALTERSIQARDPDFALVLVCKHPDFTGNCYMSQAFHNACVNVESNFNDRITSLQNMNRDTWKCRFWERGWCMDYAADIQWDNNLSAHGGFRDDKISSWARWRVSFTRIHPFPWYLLLATYLQSLTSFSIIIITIKAT